MCVVTRAFARLVSRCGAGLVSLSPLHTCTCVLTLSATGIHALVSFTGAIAEKNGDVGATASCVFAIDGTDVDAVTGLWVDAGDTVNCQFNHVFTTAGTYTVRISATGIVPGDWDDTNNQATATITILEPSKAIQSGSMWVEQRNTSYYHRYSRSGYYYYNYNNPVKRD